MGLACIAFAHGANAQQTSRALDWRVTPYLWGAGIEGDVAAGPQTSELEMDFSDLVDMLAGAALLRIEAGGDEHSLIGDLVWMQLEPETASAASGGTAEIEALMLDAGYIRKLNAVDLELGVRYWDMEIAIDPALLAEAVRDDSWIDAYVGFRLIRQIGEDWAWQTRVNIGAGGSDSTYGIETHFARELAGGNKVVVGLKALGVDYRETSLNGVPFEFDATFLGGTIGFMFD
jgi:hypothetical protein